MTAGSEAWREGLFERLLPPPRVRVRSSRCVRLDDDVAAVIAALAVVWRVSRSEVVRRALDALDALDAQQRTSDVPDLVDEPAAV